MNYISESHLRMAVSHAIAGGLFYGMDMEDVIRIVKEVADDYKGAWKEETKS